MLHNTKFSTRSVRDKWKRHIQINGQKFFSWSETLEKCAWLDQINQSINQCLEMRESAWMDQSIIGDERERLIGPIRVRVKLSDEDSGIKGRDDNGTVTKCPQWRQRTASRKAQLTYILKEKKIGFLSGAQDGKLVLSVKWAGSHGSGSSLNNSSTQDKW